jgi:hypothetical protein
MDERFRSRITLRPTVSRPVSLGVKHPSGTYDQFYFRLEIFFRQLRVCNFLAPSLTRGRVFNLLYNCFWVLPEHSLLGRSPAELTTIFYLRIPQTGGVLSAFMVMNWVKKFSVWSASNYIRTNGKSGGCLEYFHRSPVESYEASKENPVPGGITGPLCSCGI